MFDPKLSFAVALSVAVLPADAGAQPPQAESNTIVVTGPSRDLRRALETCLARNCPVNEDVDASAALAESLFLEGDYAAAHRVIRQSLGRNRDEAARFPEPVSELYRANSRLARHLGYDREAIRSTHQTLRALQAGLPSEDHRHFSARLEVAQMLVAFGKYDEALGELRDLGERARAAGREDVAATTMLRRLWISYLSNPGGTAIRRLEARAAGGDRGLAIGARLVLVRIYGERSDTARADALIAELSRMTGQRQLLYAPPYELVQREDVDATNARRNEIAANLEIGAMLTSNHQDRLVDNLDGQWLDVAFWVTGTGRVEDLEVVRRGAPGGWEVPLLQSIRGRRYTADGAGERTYRLERYTYTSELRPQGTGTRVADRSPRARVEYLDLSEARPGTN